MLNPLVHTFCKFCNLEFAIRRTRNDVGGSFAGQLSDRPYPLTVKDAFCPRLLVNTSSAPGSARLANAVAKVIGASRTMMPASCVSGKPAKLSKP